MNTNDTPIPSSSVPAEASDPVAGRCAVASGSAHWCWTEDLEAEIWHGGGASKGEAMLAAQREGHSSFWVAPTRPAGEADVNDWMGDDDIEVGDPMIDVGRIEEIPQNNQAEARAAQNTNHEHSN